MDYILNGTAHGDVASRLLNSRFDTGMLRPYIATDEESGEEIGYFVTNAKGEAVPVTNATLRYDEWKQYDTAILKAARTRLTCAQTFLNAGMTYNLPNGLGKTVLTWETLNDMNPATVGMDPRAAADEDRPVFGQAYMPLPIIYKEFRVSVRQLEASRTTGEPLDVTAAEQAGRVVAEMIEEITCNGYSSFAFGGGTLYGISDFTSATTDNWTADWDDSGADPLADLLRMKQDSIDAGYYGPWHLFLPTNFETVLDEDFKAASDKGLRQRLLEVGGIQGITIADKLTADYGVLVQMTSDNMRMVNGLPITTVQWETRGGMEINFMVMAIMLPNPRADQNGNCGIIVYS